MLDPGVVTRHFAGRRERMLELLGELVRRESPSTEKSAVDHLVDYLQPALEGLPGQTQRVTRQGVGDCLVHRRPADGVSTGKGLLLLAHTDTVWPLGTLSVRPYRVEGGVVAGPGCLDDKSGLVLAVELLRGVRDLGLTLGRPLTVIFNSDEEIGSPLSRGLIEEESRRSGYVLCLEAAGDRGQVTSSRRAVGRFVMEVTGKSAHAGLYPDQGVCAVEELARQVLDLHGLSDPEKGTRVHVGVISGGTQVNVIASQARAEIDLRAPTTAAAQELSRRVLALRAHHPGAVVEVTGGVTRPAMERASAAAGGLLETVREVARGLGISLKEVDSGGGSDASFASALGVPTLDGLGVVGQGVHAAQEHVQVESLAERAALLLLLVERLANAGTSKA